ncbi:MAG: permease, partial [Firmicutes bacterium]|nr:permease [Bacillota bacterium]
LSLFGALMGPRVLVLYVATTFTAAVLAGIVLEALGLGRYVKKVRIIGTLRNSEKGGAMALKERVKTAAQNAVGLFRQMVPYLLVGVAIGAFIYGFLPAGFLARVAGPDNPLAIPVAAAIGVPLYVRTETVIPVGFAMIQKGVSLGAIVALAIGGAGASIPELSMLAGVFKRKLWVAYIITMFAIATIIGYLFNFLVSM